MFLEWDPDDRNKVIAHFLEEGDRCQKCGTKGYEWEENRWAYDTEVHQCMGCYIQDAAQENTKDSLPGTTVRLVANTPQRQAQLLLAHQRRAQMGITSNGE